MIYTYSFQIAQTMLSATLITICGDKSTFVVLLVGDRKI